MKVTVDDERCAGHGVCVTLCPKVFTLTADGYSVADPSEVSAELEGAVQDAIKSCPEHAITVI